MSVWTTAFYARLAGDSGAGGLVSKLATYGTRPAIFSYFPTPEVSGLYVVMTGNIVASPDDTKNDRGRTVERRIYVYGPATGSTTAVEAAAERIRFLFHRKPLTVSGFSVYIAVAEGPIEVPGGDDLYGRMVIVTMTGKES